MKKLGLAFGALIAPAVASEKPLKTKAPPPIFVYSWMGVYIGGNAGYAWGRDDVSSVDFSSAAQSVDLAATRAATSPSLRPNGFTGGGQIGYNWQTGNIVFGLEADFNSVGLRASQGGTSPFPSTLPGGTIGPPTEFFTDTTSVSTDWLFTARPRIGWAANTLLFYVTGGLAVAGEKFNQTLALVAPFVVTSSKSATRTGGTAGGGAEWALNRNWSAKVEYLYADFGTVSTSGVETPIFPGSSFNNTAHLTTSIVRVGINYKFAWGGLVAARY